MSEQTKKYERFNIARRLEHILLIISFSTLAITGLVQKYALNTVSIAVISFLGGIELVRIIHRIAAIIFFLEGVYHFILMAYLVYLLLFKTTWGMELRMVGANPNAAKYAGIKITRATVVAMALSGALAGMAGANEVLGVNYRLLPAFSSGYGFDSIALALLGKTHPLGVILSSLLFGFLRNGARSMQLAVGVPIDIVSILQAVILAFIAAPAIIRTIYRLKEPKHQEELVSLRSWKG